MSNRTTNTLILTIARDPAPVAHSKRYRAASGETWEKGDLLTELEGGLVAAFHETVDGNVTGPVKGIANEDYDGEGGDYVSLTEIGPDVRLTGQIATGSADQDDIGKQGRLLYDETSGKYRVDLSATEAPSIQVTDVEPRATPFGQYAKGNFNLVEFKVLAAVLNKAPASVS